MTTARRATGVLATTGGALLVTLHFLPLAFDLPAGAANLSPFRDASFGIPTLALRPVAALVRDAEWPRVALWLGLVGVAWGLVRSVPPLRVAVERCGGLLRDLPERRFVTGLLAAELLLLVAISWFVFDHMPHVQDGIGQLFQARIFAGGHLVARPPALPDLFSFYSVVLTDQAWYSQHPPGWPLVLAPFVLAGVPWLAGPLLGVGCVGLTYRLGRRLVGGTAARVAALLLLLSPFHAFMAASFMNHTATLFFLLLGASLLADEAPRFRRVVLAGAALGLAIATRPLVGLVLTAWVAALALARPGGRPARHRTAGALALGLAAPTALFLAYNAATNGSPFLLGYSVADAAFHRLGFAAAPVPYSPLRALIKTAQLIRGLDVQLFAWPIPSLLPVWFLLFRGPARRTDLLLLSTALLVPLAYYFYWFQDMCLGPRFAYASIPCFALLAARAIVDAGPRRPATRGWLRALVLGCVAWSLLTAWPALARGYASSYWGVDRELVRRVERERLRDAVVLVGDRGCPWYYGAGFWANTPDLAGPVIYARDPGPGRAALVAGAFPGRSVYRYDCRDGSLTPAGRPGAGR